MANDESKKLTVDVLARIDKLERGMAKAAQTFSSRSKEMEDRSKKFASNFENNMTSAVTKVNGALGKLGLGGIAAGGIAGIVAGFRQIAGSVAEVGDAAKIAGVDVKAFQELKFVAEQNRIGIEALTDGLKEMNLRADEFILTGKGSGAEAFARLGLSADSLKQKLKDPSALFTEIIGKLSTLDKAAQIRIADEVFGGTGGEVFVKLIDQGEAGIRKTIKAANELGIVMDRELIASATEVDRQFNVIATTVEVKLKGAIINAAAAMQGFLDKYKEYQGRLAGADAAAQVGAMLGSPPTITPGATTSTPAAPKGPRLPSAKDIIRDKLNEQRLNDAFNGVTSASTGGDKKRSSSISAAERERAAVKELITELEEELRLVNASDVAKRASAASRQAGAAATDSERQRIIALTESIHQEEEARRRSEEQMLLYRDLTKAGLDDLFAGLEQGKSLWDSMAAVAVNSLKRIGDSLINDVLDNIFKVNGAGNGGGGGLLSGLFGGLFGGGGGKFPAAPGGLYADGGYTGPGGKWQAAGTVHKGEVVFSKADVARNGGVAATEALRTKGAPTLAVPTAPTLSRANVSGNVTTPISISIDATGADSAGLARVERQLAQLKADLPATVVKTVQNAQGRRAL